MSQYWCPKDGDSDAWIVVVVAATDLDDVQPCPSIERGRCRECRWVPFLRMKVGRKELTEILANQSIPSPCAVNARDLSWV
jgi:hypothetical protein